MSVLIRPLLVLLAFVVIVVLILVALFGGFGGGGGDSTKKPADKKQQPSHESKQGTIKAADLTVGDCISDANSTTGDVTTFDGVKCDDPHDGEVFTLIELKGGPKARYPGAAFVNGKGQRGCRARLRRQATARAFRDRRLGFKFVYPTPASWGEGDREITCVATFKKPRTKQLAQRSQ
jgi:hypothetical protein